jgi:hypothetical protein
MVIVNAAGSIPEMNHRSIGKLPLDIVQVGSQCAYLRLSFKQAELVYNCMYWGLLIYTARWQII